MSNNLSHISDKPWSDYKESDYTLQQWHNACLIHNHTGPPTSKNQCKLPVKTPNGVVNSNGVQAAAAALAGARGGVKDVSSDQRTSAINALKGYYKDMGKELPLSLQHTSIEEFLSHYGVKGQHWGIRNTPVKVSTDHKQAASLKKKHPAELSNDQLKKLNERMNLEANYNRLNPSKVKKGHDTVKKLLGTQLTATAAIAFFKSPMGKKIVQNGKRVIGPSIKKGVKSIGK